MASVILFFLFDLFFDLVLPWLFSVIDRLPGKWWKPLSAVCSLLVHVVFLNMSISRPSGILVGFLLGFFLGAILDVLVYLGYGGRVLGSSLTFQQSPAEADADGEERQGLATDAAVGTNQWAKCDYCDAYLDLDYDELTQDSFVCPECLEMSQSATKQAEASDTVLDATSRDIDKWTELVELAVAEEVALYECGHCGRTLALSIRELARGWFFCPKCRGLGSIDDCVTCLSCNSTLELSDKEWEQGWYCCPECNQETLLVNGPG